MLDSLEGLFQISIMIKQNQWNNLNRVVILLLKIVSSQNGVEAADLHPNNYPTLASECSLHHGIERNLGGQTNAFIK